MARAVAASLAIAIVFVAVAVAVENKGAPLISLNGGSRGKVPFPHHQHQETLKDCQVCHTLFPQEQGGIMRLKEEGKLVKKQVMNKHCIKCHRSTQKNGGKSGPTTCAKCHVKE